MAEHPGLREATARSDSEHPVKPGACLLLALALLQAVPLGAQSSPATVLLPGDELPPPLARMLAPPPPRGTPRPPLPAPPVGPPLALALKAARAALVQCRSMGIAAGSAVSDSGGNLILGLTEPGASPGRIYVAARKNLAALAYGTPSSAAKARLHDNDPAALQLFRPNMMTWGGAVPLIAGGHVIGAVGVSGGTQVQDEQCASAGARAIARKLR